MNETVTSHLQSLISLAGLILTMGGCSSSPNSEINKKMRTDVIVQTKVNKILLLGSGSSGKSTLFRQLKIIHEEQSFDKNDKIVALQVCRQVII